MCRKLISLLLVVIAFVALFAGCQSSSMSDTTTAATASTASTAAVTTDGETGVKLPLTDKAVTLTYYGVNIDEQFTELYKELQKRTGITLKAIYPPTGQSVEHFNLMIASGEYPDIIEHDWLNFPAEKAIADGIIIKLNDLLDTTLPNLKKVLSSNPEWDKAVKTDNGSYYVFPYLRGDPWLQTYAGFIYRKDWLDELNLSVPETIDEFESLVKTFKEKRTQR